MVWPWPSQYHAFVRGFSLMRYLFHLLQSSIWAWSHIFLLQLFDACRRLQIIFATVSTNVSSGLLSVRLQCTICNIIQDITLSNFRAPSTRAICILDTKIFKIIIERKDWFTCFWLLLNAIQSEVFIAPCTWMTQTLSVSYRNILFIIQDTEMFSIIFNPGSCISVSLKS